MHFSLFDSSLIVLISTLTGFIIAIYKYKKLQFKLEQDVIQANKELAEEHIYRQQSQQELIIIERELRELYGRLSVAEERVTPLAYFRQECENLHQELRTQIDKNSNQEAELRELTIRLEEAKLAAEDKQRLLINSEQRLTTQFENLANRIFEQNGRKADLQNRHSLDQMLIPLREQLDGFRRQIQENFGQESRERHTLTHEIRNLHKLNAQISQEAVNLTRALKGNYKTQGNWGEVMLSRILEASGLREGHEFETQVNIKQVDGRRMQPDVVIKLPQGQCVVIDSKMSLIAYERYFNSDNKDEQQTALNEHLHSIRNHIKLLGKKNYQQLPNLNSLDYILMFIPVEAAFIVAIDKQPELICEALTNNIMLVSPTTLLVALRTINNLWRYENQNRNSQHIADRAARLYDKIRLFIDDMITIGQNLDKAETSYRLAMNKFSEGRGNILSQAEGFRCLGVDVKRAIKPGTSNTGQFDNKIIE